MSEPRPVRHERRRYISGRAVSGAHRWSSERVPVEVVESHRKREFRQLIGVVVDVLVDAASLSRDRAEVAALRFFEELAGASFDCPTAPYVERMKQARRLSAAMANEGHSFKAAERRALVGDMTVSKQCELAEIWRQVPDGSVKALLWQDRDALRAAKEAEQAERSERAKLAAEEARSRGRRVAAERRRAANPDASPKPEPTPRPGHAKAIRDLLRTDPDLSGAELARRVGCDPSTACRTRGRFLRDQSPSQSTQ